MFRIAFHKRPIRVWGCFRNERGFTLVEMLLAAGLLGFLASVTAVAYHFSIRLGSDWRARAVLEENARVCINRVAEDVAFCERISIVDDSTTLIRRFRPGTLLYKRRGGIVFRNGFPLNTASVIVDTFRIRPPAADPSETALIQSAVADQPKLRETGGYGVYAVDVTVRYRQRTLSTSTWVSQRGTSGTFKTE